LKHWEWSLPYSSSNPALSEAKKNECHAAGHAIRHLLENDISHQYL